MHTQLTTQHTLHATLLLSDAHKLFMSTSLTVVEETEDAASHSLTWCTEQGTSRFTKCFFFCKNMLAASLSCCCSSYERRRLENLSLHWQWGGQGGGAILILTEHYRRRLEFYYKSINKRVVRQCPEVIWEDLQGAEKTKAEHLFCSMVEAPGGLWGLMRQSKCAVLTTCPAYSERKRKKIINLMVWSSNHHQTMIYNMCVVYQLSPT